MTATLLHALPDPEPSGELIGHRFGISAAISGDTVVAGADYGDEGGFRAGCVYVFDATSGSLRYKLTNPTPEAGDDFAAVAIWGNTIVVGASGDDTGAQDAGSAYVFDATTGALLHTLNNPTPGGIYGLGRRVAIWGSTVVGGASGRAYVFDATTGALLHTLSNPNPAAGKFGDRVAIWENTVVVGAGYSPWPSQSAYVFDATTGGLLHTLNNPRPEEDVEFGTSVAVWGDTIVIGAERYDTGAASAYVFDARTGALQHTLDNPRPEDGDSARIGDGFGRSVAISANSIVVGAVFEDTAARVPAAGSAYVFDATTGALRHTLDNPSPEEGDFFGWVGIWGNTVVVGEGCGLECSNTAYVFSLGNLDFNDDGLYGVADLDLLSAAIAFGNHPSGFDLTDDGFVNLDDQSSWLVAAGAANLPSGRPYPLGDANLDGLFDSSDFVQVFQAGKYEDGNENNAVWSSGDWNGDGDFDSADFVAAFQTGLYEANSRAAGTPLAAAVDWLFAQGRRASRSRAHVA